MGSESSKNNNEFKDNSLLDSEEDEIEYNKQKKSPEEEGYLDNTNEDSFQKGNNNTLIKEEKIKTKNTVPVVFRWDGEGNSVYVTGSFCNWTQFFLMKKNNEGAYELKLDLPKCRFEYKFKVDGEWKCNKKYPVCINENNENNYLDTTNWEISIDKSEDSTTDLSNLYSRGPKSAISCSEFEKSKNNYSLYIPKRDQMNIDAPRLPGSYKNIINLDINEKQNKIGENKYLSAKENNILSDNYTYKKINNLQHEQINHLRTNLGSAKNNIEGKSSFVSRYRLKFTTFVYYK